MSQYRSKHPQFPRWYNIRLQSWQASKIISPISPNWTCKLVTFHRMWPRKYGWLNFVILECSLNVWIVNKIVFAAPELCESALPNPKFLLHCRKWRNINLSWRKFSNIDIFHIPQIFLVKTYKRDQWSLPNILAYISGIFDGFFKAGLVPLSTYNPT